MIKRGSLIEVENTKYYDGGQIIKVFSRGACLRDCEMGEQAEIITFTGHVIKGIVSQIKYFYNRDYYLEKNVKEVLSIKVH